MELDSDITAIVTGGVSGLGAAVVSALRERKVNVSVFDLGSDNSSHDSKDPYVNYINCDVADQDSCLSAFTSSRERFGQERILINCAGINFASKTASVGKKDKRIKTFPMDQFIKTINVNLIGTFRCASLSAAGMLDLPVLGDSEERGVIINTASIAATDGQIGQAAYASSKAGVVGLTLPVARDLMDYGIRINTIMPGIFDTPMLAALPDNVRDAIAENIPFPRRLGQTEEFAKLALSIINNSYLNGESIRLDGGVRLAAK